MTQRTLKPATAVFEHSTRNWLIASAAVASLVFAAFGAASGAPWYWFLIVGLPGVAALGAWALDRRSGYRIHPGEVYFHQGSQWDLRLRPEQILHASIHPDSEGPDQVVLHLQNGSSRQLPADCVGKTWELAEALEGVGIDVRHA